MAYTHSSHYTVYNTGGGTCMALYTLQYTLGGTFMEYTTYYIRNIYGIMTYTVRKFNWWRYWLALWDEIFGHKTLIDETLRHIELCNSVISQIQRNQLNLF